MLSTAGGAVWTPLLIIAVALYPVRLGFYYFAYPFFGSDAIWLSFPAGSLAGKIAWRVRRGGLVKCARS